MKKYIIKIDNEFQGYYDSSDIITDNTCYEIEGLLKNELPIDLHQQISLLMSGTEDFIPNSNNISVFKNINSKYQDENGNNPFLIIETE